MQVELELKTGVLSGEKIYLAAGQSVTVGRSETARFPIPTDGQMSGLHFEVNCNENDCVLIDLNSTNGTRLNGETVGDSILNDGDQISAGQSLFLVRIRPNSDIFDSAIQENPAVQAKQTPSEPDIEDSIFPSSLGSVATLPGTIKLTADGDFDIRVIPGNSVTIGRTERADYAITHDGHMSGIHFSVLNDGGRPRVRDEQSTNKTRLNGNIVSEHELTDGDVITAGRTEFQVSIHVAEPDGPPGSSTLTDIPTGKVLVPSEDSRAGTPPKEKVTRKSRTIDESSFIGDVKDLYATDSPLPEQVPDNRKTDLSGPPVTPHARDRQPKSREPDGVEQRTNEFPNHEMPIGPGEDLVKTTPKPDSPPDRDTDEVDSPTPAPSTKSFEPEEKSPPIVKTPVKQTPVAKPDKPVAPVEPPTKPVTPVEPPTKPVAPVEPPTKPVTPVEPPTKPVAPVEPPTKPVAPVEPPTKPVAPVKPPKPVAPIEPPKPVAPKPVEKPQAAEPVCNTELKIVIIEYSTAGGEPKKFWMTPNQMTIVGRGTEAHERIQDDSQIKDRHFALSTDEKACRIMDLESSGTFLNDHQIESEYVLNDDTIRAGATTFKIQVVGGIEQVKRFS